MDSNFDQNSHKIKYKIWNCLKYNCKTEAIIQNKTKRENIKEQTKIVKTSGKIIKDEMKK